MNRQAIDKSRLDWFVEQMERKLNLPKNEAKPDWRLLPLSDVMARLEGELAELQEAIREGTGEDIIIECADVANYAFFIADWVRTKGGRP